MKILVFGDSHSNIFAGMPGAVHLHSPIAVTARRVADWEFREIWDRPGPWLQQHQGAECLVLSSSEIDIRAHFWRHLPLAISQGSSIEEFVASKVGELVNCIERIQSTYNIARVILWSAPPATANTNYNADWPFVGSVSTRNTLIHLFNCEFQQQIRSKSSIAVATGFYDYIDPISYLPKDHIPSDGVHWHISLVRQLWEQHIVPNVQGVGVDLGTAYQIMKTHSPSFVDQSVVPGCLYDTWVRTDDLVASKEDDTRAVVNGVDYSRIHLQDRSRFPANYRELSLINQ